MATAKILEIDSWETPASKYAVEQVGTHRLMPHTYKPGFYSYHGMDGYTLFSLRSPITSVKLMEYRPGELGASRWHEWMVDSPTDYRAMQKYAERAFGRVITTGLGLGLVTQELVKNNKVMDIVVVELSQDVVELIGKYLPPDPRIHIINDNFWNFISEDNTPWDTMIVDIWVYYGMEQQVKMYREEIIPADRLLRGKYPKSQIFFHGFAGMPSLNKLAELDANGDIHNPLVVDPLIYGLGERW